MTKPVVLEVDIDEDNTPGVSHHEVLSIIYGMLRRTSKLAQAAQFISKDEFLESFLQIWPSHVQTSDKLGIAVSGGVDSMALALMCKRYIPDNDNRLLAFVVDHTLRETSTAEAEHVQKIVEDKLGEFSPCFRYFVKLGVLLFQKGIPTQILTLAREKPELRGTNLETLARKLRYRALGLACYEKSIDKLLIGHHEDDQYELVLQRLVASHSQGLKAMSSHCAIPESLGVYGVHESGSPQILPWPAQHWSRRGVKSFEGGGVTLGRPLLRFKKERLVATCEKFDIPWVEDETNQDRTLCSRNAIRHIIRNHKLPQALSRQSLLKLREAKVESANRWRNAAEQLFEESQIQLDLRTGTLTARIPDLSQRLEHEVAHALPSTPRTDGEWENLDTSLMCRLAKLVSPYAIVEAAQFRDRPKDLTTFSAGGCTIECIGKEAGYATLSITRQRPFKAEASHLSISFPPITNTTAGSDSKSPEFKLWDGRYWIQIRHRSPHPLCVRHLSVPALASLREKICAKEFEVVAWPGGKSPKSKSLRNRRPRSEQTKTSMTETLDLILRQSAKGPTRFTLPVIGATETSRFSGWPAAKEEKEEDEDFSLLAFPTLGLKFYRVSLGTMKPGFEWMGNFAWDIRYKKIDLGSKRPEDCIVGLA